MRRWTLMAAIALAASGLVNGGSHEKRLLNDLLDTYNVLERPVGNESEPLVLSFGLTLMQIIDVVSFQQQLQKFLCTERIKDLLSNVTRTPHTVPTSLSRSGFRAMIASIILDSENQALSQFRYSPVDSSPKYQNVE
ncbi:neuronal acetylcholine receptor subunit alpha-7-like [Frieseomelitta varia]|uniref:neuronal acetylcholine receptor subunit alpha-7-like n=1 Tax=Frieseomelitta varia TaxID=561572 RepID=UPI001CB69FC5|nr:neuronal acetylcholine receptor subunit alpha-7-like [Frieseomelitta varia]